MRVLRFLSLALLAAAVLAGPWLFGSWESWWFWPSAAALFAATTLFGVTLLDAETLLAGFSARLLRRDAAPALIAMGLFLVYGAVRMLMAPVYTDAERSFLLFLLPFFTAGIVAFSTGSRARRIGFYLLAANALALGLYGIINQWVTGGERVMWMPGYMMYIADDRATGSYYCPNHFAGILELGAALALGLLLDRGARPGARGLAGFLLAICLWGVVISRSRGGGLTMLALLALAPWLGLVQWRPRVRVFLRGGLLLLALAGAGLVAWQVGEYRARFLSYPWKDLEHADRVLMVSGALRAWETAPAAGIGPGMHQNLWPHFAASADGDREKGVWPSHPNVGWHSYEVHSDWVQLMEEYGIVGLVLFLAALALVLRWLWRGLRREEADWRAGAWMPPAASPRFCGVILAGLLAACAMMIHEVADFNLQMPATGWMLGAILGLAAGEAVRSEPDQ